MDAFNFFTLEGLEPRLLLDALPGGTGTFFDTDGDKVVVKLTGPGTVTVVLDDADADGKGPLGEVLLQGTDARKSKLTITVSKVIGGDGLVTVSSLSGGDLAGLTAKNCDFIGTGIGLGAVATLTVHDVLAEIQIGGDVTQKTAITAHLISNANITLDSTLDKLTAARWDGGALTAPAAGKITINGDTAKANPLDGDLLASLYIGDDIDPGNLAGVTAAGGFGGTWEVYGNTGPIASKGIINGWTAAFHGQVQSLKLNDIMLADVTADDLIGAVSATQWQAGTITAPAIATLTTSGNKRLAIAGDFNAELQLGDRNSEGDTTVRLTSAKIAGALGAPAEIHGSVGSLTVGQFNADVMIDGDAPKIKVNQSLATVSPNDGQSYTLTIGGEASVTDSKETIKFTNNRLYTTQPGMYAMEDIRRYDQLGAWWDYDATFKGSAGTGSASVRVAVGDQTQTVNGLECSVISSGVGGTVSSAWHADADGIRMESWSLDSPSANVQFFFDAQVASPTMFLKDAFKGTGTITGDWDIVYNGVTIHGTVDGDIVVSSTLLGHEEVMVPAGIYLAAKVSTTATMTGDVSLSYQGIPFTAVFTVVNRQTWWGVDSVGIVKATDYLSVKVNVHGVGSQSMYTDTTMVLTDSSNIV